MKSTTVLFILFGMMGGVLYFGCAIDHGLEPIRSGFSGTIRYRNAWPDSIADVRLVTTKVSFEELLASISEGDITQLIFSDPLPSYVDSTQYVFWAKPATYTAVVLAGKRQGEAWSEKSILAVYPNILFPQSVTVPDEHTLVKGIDFSVRFK